MGPINGQVQHSVNSTSQSTLLHNGRTKRKVSVHAGLRCVTCADLQSSFFHYIMKSKGSHWPMSVALVTGVRPPSELALFTFWHRV